MLKSLRRHARNVVTVAGLVIGLVLGLSSPAFASLWALQDGFESNPAATWWFQSSGNGFGNFDGTNGTPHTGSRYADVYRFDAGWASVGRNVHLTPAANHPSNCSAQIWLQQAPGTRVNFEIINPSTWTYISLNQITLPNDWQWHAYTSGSWKPGPVDVVVRVSAVSTGGFAGVKVDDLTVQCSY
ncbi:hypothetical protein [Dactylosporangium sp. NPDC051484]|uniref:hypothetical protein n=1 Tax=Dactylosporangium sp. NPDC051484 TaxID=3154942 RepID=UPI00344F7820